MATFRVTRQHLGDRLYMPGDEREANESDVAHLVERGVLELVKAKAAQPVENKAEPKLRNKSRQ